MGRVTVTVSSDPPMYQWGSPNVHPRTRPRWPWNSLPDPHRPITMAELDRKIAHMQRRKRERADAGKPKRYSSPRRRPQGDTPPKGWTVCES